MSACDHEFRRWAVCGKCGQGFEPPDEVPAWFLAFMVDAHKIADELRRINQTLLRVELRVKACEEVVGVKKS